MARLSRFFVVFLLTLAALIGGGCDGGTRGTGPSSVEVKGQLKSFETGLPIAGARITAESTGETTTTDQFGNFTFNTSVDPEDLALFVEVRGTQNRVPVDIPEGAEQVFVNLEFNETEGTVTVVGTDAKKSDDEKNKKDKPKKADPVDPSPLPKSTSTPTPENPNPQPTPRDDDKPGSKDEDKPGPKDDDSPSPTPITLNTPTVTNAPSIWPASQIELRGSKSRGSSVELNGNQIVDFSEATEWQANVNLSQEGQNELSLRARDSKGNQSAVLSIVIIRDTTAPQLVKSELQSVSQTSATLAVEASDPASIFVAFIVNGNPQVVFESSGSAVNHTVVLNNLTAETIYQYSVALHDVLGNERIVTGLSFTTSADTTPTGELVGDGSFLSGGSKQTPNGQGGLTVGDFDGDTIPDVILLRDRNLFSPGTMQFMRGQPDGQLSEMQALDIGKSALFIANGDLNQDGNLDLVTQSSAVQSVELSVHYGNGDGTFQAPRIASDGTSAHGVAVEDLDGDGQPEIVTISLDRILRGYMLKTYTMTQPAPELASAFDLTNLALTNGYRGTGTYEFTIADVDSDNLKDVIILSQFDTYILKNNGATGFSFFSRIHASAISPLELAAGDFNCDGRTDVYSGEYLMLGQGDGTFLTPVPFNMGWGKVAVSDINKDGCSDLIGQGGATPQGPVLVSPMRVRFGDKTLLLSEAYDSMNTVNSRQLQIADFNLDGIPDVLTLTTRQTSIPDQNELMVSVLLSKTVRTVINRVR